MVFSSAFKAAPGFNDGINTYRTYLSMERVDSGTTTFWERKPWRRAKDRTVGKMKDSDDGYIWGGRAEG